MIIFNTLVSCGCNKLSLVLAASCSVDSLFQITKLAGKIWVYEPATHGSHKIKDLVLTLDLRLSESYEGQF